jgi:dienelactone hydrolase
MKPPTKNGKQNMYPKESDGSSRVVRIDVGNGAIEGALTLPTNPQGIVIFAHGSGSSRHSPRNQFVARQLNSAKFGTLLIDLLKPEEEQVDLHTRRIRFDIGLLAERVEYATDWVTNNGPTAGLPPGYFGASTGAAAALVAAAHRPVARAVVSRGGRPDLAGEYLSSVQAATLLIVGGEDHQVIELNRAALAQLSLADRRELHIIPHATHLFEEPGTLEEVVRLATKWFADHLSIEAPTNQREEFIW